MVDRYFMERYKCEICGKIFRGLMSFAAHTAQSHGMSAIDYWNKYDHHGENGNKNINPSARNVQVWENYQKLKNQNSQEQK